LHTKSSYFFKKLKEKIQKCTKIKKESREEVKTGRNKKEKDFF
jgi:hypothetical protein